MYSIPPEVVNQTHYDWLSFFLGGAVGSIIVLGLEKLFDFLYEKYRTESAEKQLSAALNQEIKENLRLCEIILSSLNSDKSKIYFFARFDHLWITTFSDKCIDFTNSDSLRLQSFLFGIKKLMEQIHNFESNLYMFVATSRALGSFSNHVQDYNRNILNFTIELKSSLLALDSCRKGDKIFKIDIDEYAKSNNITFKIRDVI